MKIATISSVCVIFVASGRSVESSITVPNMIGAKIAPRLNVRCHDGACGSRPEPRRALGARSLPFAGGRRLVRRRARCPRRRPRRTRGGAPSRAAAAASSSPSRRLCPAVPGDPAACDHGVDDRRRRGGTRGAASRRPRRARRRRRSPARAALSGRRGRARARRSPCTPRAPPRARAGICVAASEQTSGRLSQNALPGVEVRRERDRGARVDERAAGRHRPVQEERARRAGARRRRRSRRARDAVRPGRLEVVDRPRAELDRERDRARLRELVAVESEREPGVAARRRGSDAPARRRTRRARGRRPPPRRSAPPPGGPRARRKSTYASAPSSANSGGTACAPSQVGTPPAVADRAELRELRLAVEPVARLRLERRRPGAQHPARRARASAAARPVLAGRARRAHRRQDPAARARAAPRTTHRPRGARTPRRGRRRSTRACGSRRGPGSPRARGRRAPRRRRRARASSRIRPTADDPTALAEDVRVLDDVDLAAARRPRSGAAAPAGDATCARSRTSSRPGSSPAALTAGVAASTAGRARARARRRAPPRSPASACRTTPMPGIGREHALEPLGRRVGPVGDDDHARVDRVADPDPAAVVDAHPGRARRDVDERVQDRPVRDRVGAVAHRLGLAVRATRPSPSRGGRAR